MSGTQGNVTGKKPESATLVVDPEELISSDEAAILLHQKPQTLAAWRSDNRGPEYIKVGRGVFYRRVSLGAYLAASIVVPGAK